MEMKFSTNPQELNDTVFCTLKPSSVKGIGVFAVRDIPKGTRLNMIGGSPYVRLTEDDFDSLHPAVAFLIKQKTLFYDNRPLEFIHPNALQNLQSFMNHSPNANSDGNYALRDIKEGEEVTENYSELVPNPHEFSKNILSL